MDKQLPDDFRDEIAKHQRQEIYRLRKENESLKQEKAPNLDEAGALAFLWERL